MHRIATRGAFVLSAVACTIAAFGAFRAVPAPDENAIEARVYHRIVGEVWTELAPVYRDFDLRVPAEPQSLTELIRPLLAIEPDLPKTP